MNVQTISKNTKEGSRVLIAGKVLGAGTIDHGVTVIAHSFSGGAKAKIKKAGGSCVALSDYAHDANADVKGVLILG